MATLLIAAGCSRKPAVTSAQQMTSVKYDSRFPSSDVSTEIEAITKSVCKIYCITYYRTYYFPESAKFSQLDLPLYKFEKDLSNSLVSHETNTGTGLLLSFENNRPCVLTCAHIMNYPDTVISFYDNPGNISTDYIKSISFREKQEVYVKNLPSCGALNLLAVDSENDIALLGKQCESLTAPPEVFKYPAGKARDLGWGSFVYIIGYPAGTLMVTSGIISNPNTDAKGSFMIDALFNRGSSGSIVLAMRNGVPHFELVGIIRSVSTEKKFFLKPEKEIYESFYSTSEPYTGKIKVGTDETVNYGVTYSVPIEAIRDFYTRNRDDLLKSGFNLDSILGPR